MRDVNNSCTLVFPCFHLLWFGLHLLFLASSLILALGLAMMGFAFLSSFLDTSTYTIVHRCNLLPLMLKNYIISPKSSCFTCGLWENGGMPQLPHFCLYQKMSEFKIPLKLKIRGTFFSNIFLSEVNCARYGVFVDTRCAHTVLGTVIQLYT